MKDRRFNKCLNLFRNGEVNGLEEIYLEYSQKVYGSAMIIVRNKALAEEVASNVFVSVAEYSLRNKTYINKPGAWIYQITRNAALKLLAEENFNLKVEFSEELVPDWILPSPSVEFLIDFNRAVEKLSGKYKEYAVLHYIYKLKYKEIAEQFDVTVKSVERCFDRIKEHLKNDFRN